MHALRCLRNDVGPHVGRQQTATSVHKRRQRRHALADVGQCARGGLKVHTHIATVSTPPKNLYVVMMMQQRHAPHGWSSGRGS